MSLIRKRFAPRLKRLTLNSEGNLLQMATAKATTTATNTETANEYFEESKAVLDIVVHGSRNPPPGDSDIPKEILHENCILKLIGYFGKGTYGNCYEYKDSNTDMKYAAKVFRKNRTEEPQKNDTMNKKDFLTIQYHAFKEADIQKPLEHQNIVKLFWAFDDPHFVYLFMEPCIHGSLYDVIKIRHRLTAIESRYYLRQLAAGCEYLRRNLLIHRDLKLRNLFIDSNVVLKIGDFGLAKRLKDFTHVSHGICGTPSYMAPEMLAEEGYSFEVDMWAVGCIIYELLLGKNLFFHSNFESAKEEILKFQELTIPESISVDIPQDAVYLIAKLLHRNPNYRFTYREILQSAFICKGPMIPERLPSILLSSLSKPELDDDGKEVEITSEELVESIIAKWPKREARRQSYCDQQENFSALSQDFDNAAEPGEARYVPGADPGAEQEPRVVLSSSTRHDARRGSCMMGMFCCIGRLCGCGGYE